MESLQIFFYVILLAFLGLNIRTMLRRMSVGQIDPRAIPAGAVLLDVRTPAERARDSIPGSIHIPLDELTARSGELAKYKNSTIVCYCASGNRSLSAAVRLKKLGFSAVNLVGGLRNWKLAAGRR